MRNWFRSVFRQRSVPRPPTARPQLEWLERRDCPAAPVISSLSVVNTTGHTVQITGTVTDENPTSVNMNIAGVVNGSVHPNSSGAFSLTATASALGDLTVTATDNESLTSSPWYGAVTSQAPIIESFYAMWGVGSNWEFLGNVFNGGAHPATIGFSCQEEWNGTTIETYSDGTFSLSATTYGDVTEVTIQATNVWGLTSSQVSCQVSSSDWWVPTMTISSVVFTSGQTVQVTGTVGDANPAQTTVTFTGVLSGAVNPNSDGMFTFTADASALGDFSATVTNSLSVTSVTHYGRVETPPPIITHFTAVHGAGSIWTFLGGLGSGSPTTTIVTLSGPPSVHGQTITPNSSGAFSRTFTLGKNESGTVTAHATDIWGQVSNEVACFVF